MKNNFIKIGESIFNINHIQAIFPTLDREYKVLVGGEIFRMSDTEGRQLIAFIEENDTAKGFDPDKRISSTATTIPASTINKIRSFVNKHNEASMYSVVMDVSADETTVTIKGRGYDYQKSMIITNGIITTDTLQGTVYTKLKEEIIGLL